MKWNYYAKEQISKNSNGREICKSCAWTSMYATTLSTYRASTVIKCHLFNATPPPTCPDCKFGPPPECPGNLLHSFFYRVIIDILEHFNKLDELLPQCYRAVARLVVPQIPCEIGRPSFQGSWTWLQQLFQSNQFSKPPKPLHVFYTPQCLCFDNVQVLPNSTFSRFAQNLVGAMAIKKWWQLGCKTGHL